MTLHSIRREISKLTAEARRNGSHFRAKESSDVNERVNSKVRDPLHWLQNHTETKDPHWREAGAASPYRSFPDKPYFRPILERLQREPVLFCAKSRDLMLSWLFVAFFAHDCMVNPGVEVLFQSQTEEKAVELIN